MAENNNAAVDKGLIKIIRGKLSDKVRRRVTVLEAALMQEYAVRNVFVLTRYY